MIPPMPFSAIVAATKCFTYGRTSLKKISQNNVADRASTQSEVCLMSNLLLLIYNTQLISPFTYCYKNVLDGYPLLT